MSPMLRTARGLETVVSRFGRLGAWAVLALVAVTLFDVITRRFLVLGSTRLQELEWHLHTVLMMALVAWGLLRNTHVRVDLFRDRLPTRGRAWMELAGTLMFLLPYAALVLWFAIAFVRSSFEMGENSASMTGIPHRWIIKSTLALAFALVLMAGVARTLRLLSFLGGRASVAELPAGVRSVDPAETGTREGA